jgi:4-hydroxysphinganine ceramide fatty acyl 2-hydroxylase
VVYECSEYATSHPGNDKVFKMYAGKSIDKAFDEQGHTDSAHYILQQMKIEGRVKGGCSEQSRLEKVKQMYDGKWNFDYSKGMVWQIMKARFTLDDYHEFLAQPKTLVNPWRTVRLFDNPIMEAITMGPWQQTPLGFGPIAAYLMYMNELPLLESILAFVAGMLTWSFSEYFLHRFVFHGEQSWVPNNHIIIALHFLLNGNHHAFP